MRRITLWILSTVTVLVLLFSYRTSTSGASGGGSIVASSGANGANGAPAASDSAATPNAATDSTTGATAAAGQTYLGDAVTTRYGDVQVQITVQNGTVTKSEVTQVPWEGRDRQINAEAVPILNSETVQAQSANIDMVSGATFTSDGYIQSLQSALDQAGI